MGEIADALRRAETSDPSPAPPQRAAPPAPAPTPAAVGEVARSHGHGQQAPSKRSDWSSAGSPSEPASATEPEILETIRHAYVELLDHEGEEEIEAGRATLRDPHGPATHQFRRLAFRVRDLCDKRGARSIVVTSAQPFDGKTTAACNLAVQLARLDQSARIVLVDLDLHRATVARYLEVDVAHSISGVLGGEHTIDQALIDTDLPGLSLLLQARPTEQDPAWLLAHSSLQSVLRDLELRFDLVVIDTPPIVLTSDAQVILRHSAGALLVARAGASRAAAVKAAAELIPIEKRLGSILNFSSSQQGAQDLSYYSQGMTERARAASQDPSPQTRDTLEEPNVGE